MRLTAFLAAKNSHLLFCGEVSFDTTQSLYVTIFLCLIQKQFHVKLRSTYQIAEFALRLS